MPPPTIVAILSVNAAGASNAWIAGMESYRLETAGIMVNIISVSLTHILEEDSHCSNIIIIGILIRPILMPFDCGSIIGRLDVAFGTLEPNIGCSE
jgi:hypothetical protein